ncbi:MAG: hypothetical protein GF317_17700 [Candidatus Lokiarchaeota archaeon]|nr:hypothetical protein [Candidatus Lokiarchaeota archaeon]MBD3201349.1 hypothetical protein [Candidatus Lokiarchaeota archaeon]
MKNDEYQLKCPLCQATAIVPHKSYAYTWIGLIIIGSLAFIIFYILKPILVFPIGLILLCLCGLAAVGLIFYTIQDKKKVRNTIKQKIRAQERSNNEN